MGIDTHNIIVGSTESEKERKFQAYNILHETVLPRLSEPAHKHLSISKGCDQIDITITQSMILLA